jgi:hypothetical protein
MCGRTSIFFGAAYGMIHMRTYELSYYPGVLDAKTNSIATHTVCC